MNMNMILYAEVFEIRQRFLTYSGTTTRANGKVDARQTMEQIFPAGLWLSCGSFDLGSIPGWAGGQDDLSCLGELGFCVTGSHESIVANSHKSRRKHMEETSADEFLRRQGDDPVSGGVGVVSGLEGHRRIFKADQSVVGYGRAVSVPSHIGDELFGSSKGFFAINDPFLASALFDEALKSFFGFELRQGRGQMDLSFPAGVFQGIAEKLSHGFGYEPDGKQEVGFGCNPTALRFIEAATRCNDVQVGMEREVPGPGMQDGCKADVSSQSLPV